MIDAETVHRLIRSLDRVLASLRGGFAPGLRAFAVLDFLQRLHALLETRVAEIVEGGGLNLLVVARDSDLERRLGLAQLAFAQARRAVVVKFARRHRFEARWFKSEGRERRPSQQAGDRQGLSQCVKAAMGEACADCGFNVFKAHNSTGASVAHPTACANQRFDQQKDNH